jgi:hypothetical protein
MTENDRRAEDLEQELDKMQERTDRLEGEIDEARDDWERKKADPAVPGAQPDDQDHGDDEEPPPEAQYPAKGD